MARRYIFHASVTDKSKPPITPTADLLHCAVEWQVDLVVQEEDGTPVSFETIGWGLAKTRTEAGVNAQCVAEGIHRPGMPSGMGKTALLSISGEPPKRRMTIVYERHYKE